VTATYRLPGVLLPEGDRRPLWVSGGRLSATPIDDAETLPGGFVLPGLVDAHAHLAMDGMDAGDVALATRHLREARDQGVLAVRDVGAPRSVTLELRPRPDDPSLFVAGRWHAPEGRFYPQMATPTAPEELIESALQEIRRGATWVKVVADWRSNELSYDFELLRRLIEAVHAAGARVAAHTQWPVVADVVRAGVDSVEHGFSLDDATLDAMAARGVAWTPTLTALNRPIEPDTAPERRQRIEAGRERVREMLPRALARGIRVLAGTDALGTIVDEVRWLIDYGLEPVDALRAASSSSREFLGLPSLQDGAQADVTTYDSDPRDDPDALARPAAILRAGVRIA
jgi:imidazolonepropionase-like amidohydrolase